MDVYDFDKTIYRKDSTIDFFLFCLRRHPAVALSLPRTLCAAVPFLLGRRSKTAFKQVFFRFLRRLEQVDDDVALFWRTHKDRLAGPCAPQPDDMVISASPEFLLAPICKENGWLLIASRVDPKTGVYEGENCLGEEKVRRFRELFPDESIAVFYSDSYSDAPLAAIAQRAFLVRKGALKAWDS